ncbi:MAG: hypothetical protein ACXVI3_02080 [Halobacteriota archaeon]
MRDFSHAPRAIAGIILHYYRGENASGLRWGPLCGIAAVLCTLAGLWVFVTSSESLTVNFTEWTYFYVAFFLTGG